MPGGTPAPSWSMTRSPATDGRQEMDLAGRPDRLEPAEACDLAIDDDGDAGAEPAGVAEPVPGPRKEALERLDELSDARARHGHDFLTVGQVAQLRGHPDTGHALLRSILLRQELPRDTSRRH